MQIFSDTYNSKKKKDASLTFVYPGQNNFDVYYNILYKKYIATYILLLFTIIIYEIIKFVRFVIFHPSNNLHFLHDAYIGCLKSPTTLISNISQKIFSKCDCCRIFGHSVYEISSLSHDTD